MAPKNSRRQSGTKPPQADASTTDSDAIEAAFATATAQDQQKADERDKLYQQSVEHEACKERLDYLFGQIHPSELDLWSTPERITDFWPAWRRNLWAYCEFVRQHQWVVDYYLSANLSLFTADEQTALLLLRVGIEHGQAALDKRLAELPKSGRGWRDVFKDHRLLYSIIEPWKAEWVARQRSQAKSEDELAEAAFAEAEVNAKRLAESSKKAIERQATRKAETDQMRALWESIHIPVTPGQPYDWRALGERIGKFCQSMKSIAPGRAAEFLKEDILALDYEEEWALNIVRIGLRSGLVGIAERLKELSSTHGPGWTEAFGDEGLFDCVWFHGKLISRIRGESARDSEADAKTFFESIKGEPFEKAGDQRKSAQSSRPRWDRLARQLWRGNQFVKEYKQVAENQFVVLDAFEKSGWLSSIRDPLPQDDEVRPASRRMDTIKALNRGQDGEAIIRFSGDGTGTRISWS